MALSSRATLDRIKEQIGDLLEENPRKYDPKKYRKYRNDPARFIKEVLKGTKIWSRQIEICQSVVDHRNTVVRSSNQLGKDWVAAGISLWWTYARSGLVILSGPTLAQVKDICFMEIRRHFNRAGDLPGLLFEQALRIRDIDENMGIVGVTSSESSRLTGRHGGRVLVIVTEGQGVEDWAYEGLRANALGHEDRFLILGNPLFADGKFYRYSHAHNWNAIAISGLEHPNVVHDDPTIIPNGLTREGIAEIVEEYGEDSDVYRYRVLGEFPQSSDNALVKRAWIDQANDLWQKGKLIDKDAGPVLAIDPARFGVDQTAMVLRYADHVREILCWNKADTMQTVGRIREEMMKRNLGHVDSRLFGPGLGSDESVPIVVDEVGLGSGVLDRLKEEGYDAVGHNGSTQASNPKRFANKRSEVYWKLRKKLEGGSIALPPDARLTEELLAVRWGLDSGGRIKMESKGDLKSRLGRSPDIADAVAMSLSVDDVASGLAGEVDL